MQADNHNKAGQTEILELHVPNHIWLNTLPNITMLVCTDFYHSVLSRATS